MKARLSSIVAWTSCLAFLAAAAIYVFTWNTPPSIVNRIQLVILAAAIIGIPLGIWLGGQEKFWT